jgi:hypothetical protein
VLDAAGKYVALDLSACKGMTAWTRYDKGADKIVSLILPDTVTDIEPFTETEAYKTYPYYRGAFGFFTSLKTFKTSGVQTVGESAFVSVIQDETTGDNRYLAMLKSVDLSSATIIGEEAFWYCTTLTSVNLPSATTIESDAFSVCRRT